MTSTYSDISSAQKLTKYLILLHMLEHVASGHVTRNCLNHSGPRTRCQEKRDQSYVFLIVIER